MAQLLRCTMDWTRSHGLTAYLECIDTSRKQLQIQSRLDYFDVYDGLNGLIPTNSLCSDMKSNLPVGIRKQEGIVPNGFFRHPRTVTACAFNGNPRYCLCSDKRQPHPGIRHHGRRRGEFAFGFLAIGPGFLLAVWFEKIPNNTVAWSANGDNLVPEGSKLRLTEDNRLLLNDPRGVEVWSVNQPGSRLGYASMLDTGNLVVFDSDGKISWDTFSNPTDTILPSQTLGKGSRLVARYSETNYSGGRFALSMQDDGNLVLYTLSYPLSSPNTDYWATDTVDSGFELVFNETGRLYVAGGNGSVLVTIQSSLISTEEYYRRAVIEYDGVFRHYVYPKSSTSSDAGMNMSWSMESKPIPANICVSIRQRVGSGACGYNSYCTLGNDLRPRCECPNGYVWLDQDDKTLGCRQDFAPQSCDRANPTGDQFILEEVVNLDWPGSDYEIFRGQDLDWCRQACLSDCFCAVAFHRDLNCWKKKIPLPNGRTDDRLLGKSLIKIRVNGSDPTTEFNRNGENNRTPSLVIVIGSVLFGGSVFVNLLLVLLTLMTYRRSRSRKDDFKKKKLLLTEDTSGLRCFEYQEIREATDGFKEELGRGSFGTVYKGIVSSIFGHGGHNVAVKVLHKLTEKGDIEFKREMRAISRTNHRNLVRLLGYCDEDEHRVLVYEYMSNSSLASLLFGNFRPSWHERIEMAQGVARGLSYLHDECSTQIIHCDIKPQNVLLDDAMVAKISDFGLAKLLLSDQTRTMTELRGTRGYVAPEWFRNMPVSAKVDVYSFGILLLEIICCRKSYQPGSEDEPGTVLVDWVCDCYQEGNIGHLVEDDEEASADKTSVERFVRTALWCIQEDPSLRPTMAPPPEPYSFVSST